MQEIINKNAMIVDDILVIKNINMDKIFPIIPNVVKINGP